MAYDRTVVVLRVAVAAVRSQEGIRKGEAQAGAAPATVSGERPID